MGHRTVIWKKRAQKRFGEIAEWYESRVGIKARENFISDTIRTISVLRDMPTIGTIDEHYGQGVYTFPSHALIRIAYTFDEATLTVVALRSTRMKN